MSDISEVLGGNTTLIENIDKFDLLKGLVGRVIDYYQRRANDKSSIDPSAHQWFNYLSNFYHAIDKEDVVEASALLLQIQKGIETVTEQANTYFLRHVRPHPFHILSTVLEGVSGLALVGTLTAGSTLSPTQWYIPATGLLVFAVSGAMVHTIRTGYHTALQELIKTQKRCLYEERDMLAFILMGYKNTVRECLPDASS